MEKQYTIKEAADAAGLTKNAARYRLQKCAPEEMTMGPDGRLLLSERGLQRLKETVKTEEAPKDAEKPAAETIPEKEEPLAQTLQSVIDALTKQLETKDRQIERLQDQVDTITKALQSAQALHAGTLQQQIAEPGKGDQTPSTDPEAAAPRDLAADSTPEAPETPDPAPDQTQKPEKKKTFWKRLFGR